MPRHRRAAARVFGQLEGDGFVVERLLIETLPGFYVGANLYRPSRMAARGPAVLVAHGHWKRGRVEHSDVYSVPALGHALARNGYVALAFDMVGYNDTHQVPHKFGETEEEQLWSYGPLGLQLWNSIRMVDYLSTRPEVDPARIAVTGASGGGTQSYLLAAVDERIRLSIPAVMVSSRFQGDDACEMAPGLRIRTNNMEIAAAAAPRPQLLLSSARDWTSLTPQVEFPAIREIYGLLGVASRVESFHMDAEHGYNEQQRQAALDFLGKHFGMPAVLPKVGEFKFAPEELLIGPKVAGSVAGAADKDGVFEAWKRLMTRRNQRAGAAQRTELLRLLTGGHWPSNPQLIATGGEGFLHREGEDDVVPARLLPGAASVSLLVVNAKGMAAARASHAVQAAVADGRQVLMIDAFGTGAAADARQFRHNDHLVFHHADDANRVQDILTAAAWLDTHGARAIRLVCGGGAEAWCKLAAAIAPREFHVDVDAPRPRRLVIPGLLAAGYVEGSR